MDPQPGPSPPPSPPAFNPPSLPPRPTIARKPVPSLSERPSPPPLPPRPPKDDAKIADIDEKQHRTTPRSRRCYPATRQGRLCLWSLLSSLVVVIAVVIAVLATVLPHRTSFPDNGGHPLDVAHGGVSIGKPGDIVKLGANSTDHFVLTTNRSSVVTRLDPIVNPNALGSHLHRFHGSSYITPNLTKASDMQKLADCSTTVVQDDKSSYWVAQLYYRYPNGTLVAVHVYYTSLYYFMKAPIGVPIYPFPDKYNIVAGDPYRRTVNDSDP